ncbi:phage tail protein, partial [Streptococcus anginosus]
MAIVGLKMVTLALVDDNQKLIKGAEGLSESGIIEIDDKMWGSKTANITNLEGSVTKVPGNNKVQDVYTAPGAPQIAFDFNNLDFDVKQKIKGYKSDGKGGYVYQGSKP